MAKKGAEKKEVVNGGEDEEWKGNVKLKAAKVFSIFKSNIAKQIENTIRKPKKKNTKKTITENELRAFFNFLMHTQAENHKIRLI